ncbi:MAG TPA: tripartite tricarboxylate transporter substrate-binding protein [Xanthobacteraceae bacterium]|jgi:tripartite-type tricarboxylate transporter receptor subunit TctC
MLKKLSGAGFGALLALTSTAMAQNFPNHPMVMVIPFAAGGPQDVLGRIIAQSMSEGLGQQVIIENVGGAGGMTGSVRVAQAAPDGYTMVLGSVGTHAQNQSLFKKPLYDAAADFTPVALVAETPIALITRKDLPPNNFKEFVAYAKANQAKMQYGSAGAGSATHLGCVVLNYVIGVDITHVPYRGTGPAMQDLAGGRIDYLCDIIATAKPQIDAGAVKGLAIMTKERAAVLPNLPTTLEQGTDVQAYTWSAVFLPKGAPDAVVQKLNGAIVKAMHTPLVRDRMAGLGAVLVADDRATPQYLGQFVKSEITKWAAPIKASGVTID